MAKKYHQVKIDPTACISPAAGIVGDVTVGPMSSIFAGVQIRGDCNLSVKIGARTNVQENAVIHVSPAYPTVIGNDVSIGHGAIVHGCTVDDNVMIGMGSIVLDGAHIRSGSLVGAGALVTGGKDFPENSLIIGSPARVVRELAPEECEELIGANVREYLELSKKMVGDGVMFHPAPDFDCQVGA